MTESVFLDTNGWIALLNTSDDLHRPARAVWDRRARERTPIVLTDCFAAKTGNGLALAAGGADEEGEGGGGLVCSRPTARGRFLAARATARGLRCRRVPTGLGSTGGSGYG